MVFGPTRGDEFSQLLADGRAEGAAGALTVTEERARLVDFSQPFATEVNEVVINGPEIPAGTGFDALAATEIHVRPSSSYFTHLAALNAARGEAGEAALTVVAARSEGGRAGEGEVSTVGCRVWPCHYKRKNIEHWRC